jgi:DNA mismatch repair protein MutS
MSTNWAKLADVPPNKITPMLRQYIDAKAQAGDSLLFFRMGDFYELFFEDAIDAANLLGLALTSRDAIDKDERVPMAGVPFRNVDMYVARVIKAGRTVTICDQIEDPKDAKGVVKRAVVRTITPGTVMEPNLLDETANNYLAAIHHEGNKAGLAFVDVSTGDFLVAQIDSDAGRAVTDELVRMNPAEALVSSGLGAEAVQRLRDGFHGIAFTTEGEDAFDVDGARDLLMEQFGLSTLKGIELEDAPEALACAGAVVAYIKRMQRDAVPRLRLPRRYSPSSYVVLDGNTQRNLELVESLFDKKRRGTLISVLDKTLTSMGGRKLRHWILHPLVDVAAINARLDAIEELHGNVELRLRLRDILRCVSDLERLIGRLSSKSGSPRDMVALGLSLRQLPALKVALERCVSNVLAGLSAVDDVADVAEAIERTVLPEPATALTDGNIIRDGCNAELDHLHDLVRGGRDWISKLQRDEIQRTGISTLKVGYNKVFGYYIEVSRSYVGQVPSDYERKQTLVNAERYVTPTLKSREEEIVTAQERMNKLEYDLFCELRERVSEQTRRIHDAADAVATIDVLLSLAEVASAKGYVKPVITTSDEIRIRDGRHPVVEDLMSRGEFVANDIILDPKKASLLIVTGPNMAGKSTYLRQLALITLMAQIGSFVPAAEAHIGVVDRIFTRVGASDNLARGESTFMVEMIETASILNTATERSLLVLDEIGRGTSTFDGISIAWAVAEHIHDKIKAKTLFATHYHELTELANKLDRTKNVTVAVREWGGKVVFLYRVIDGGADHSYGIQVAKLAGLPRSVIGRAKEILESLESGNTAALGLPQQMYLFGGGTAHGVEAKPSAVEKELAQTNPDELSPRQAHEFLCHLKALLVGEPGGE